MKRRRRLATSDDPAATADRRMEWLIRGLLLATGVLILSRCGLRRGSVQTEDPPDSRPGDIGGVMESFPHAALFAAKRRGKNSVASY